MSVVTRADFPGSLGRPNTAGRTPTTVRLDFVPLRVRRERVEVHVRPGEDGWRIWSFAPRTDEFLALEAARITRAELGLPGTAIQLGAHGRPEQGLNVVFIHLVPPMDRSETIRLEMALRSAWKDVRSAPLAPSVRPVVSQALARLEHDVENAMSGFLLVHPEFTVSELRHVHEAVLGLRIDPSNFRKRVTRWVEEGLLEELATMRATATRPARLYRLRNVVRHSNGRDPVRMPFVAALSPLVRS